MAVTVSGMFGSHKTYFSDSPVIIDISGLEWPGTSPFNVVRMEVVYNNGVVGDFRADTGGQSSISFDISSALRAIWAGYDFKGDSNTPHEVLKAQLTRSSRSNYYERNMREYSLRIYTEYMSGDDGGVFTQTYCGEFSGGQCLIGGMTEWERSLITDDADRDVSSLNNTNPRNGDASTKPRTSPEMVGRSSITSWVDVEEGRTKSIFYPAPASASLPAITGGNDDDTGRGADWTGHSPLVLRDSVDYADFLFVNRRGAVETCSAKMLESMDISIDMKQYGYVERPTFNPSRSLMAVGIDGRRSWKMSSGYVTREWADWWTTEFLGGKRKQWWMLYKGQYTPVIVEPDKKSVSIYDRTKQKMPHVDFTVTLALEG